MHDGAGGDDTCGGAGGDDMHGGAGGDDFSDMDEYNGGSEDMQN